MTSPATTAQVDQASAFIRDHLDAYGVDLSDPAQRKAVQAVSLWFSAQYLASLRHSPAIRSEAWALSCTAFSEVLG